MSLISIQRSPTPTNSDVEDCVFSDTDSVDEQRTRSSLTARNRSLSECYFTVKGAAVILAHSDQASVSPRSQGHEIEAHLQSMLRVLRPQDTLSMAVRLQSSVDDHARYLAVVSTTDPSEHRESALIGFDCGKDKISIGVSVPVVGSTKVELDGDGGISVDSASSRHLFKPVSIQAMWSIFQCLHKELNYAQGCKFPNFSTWSHTWLHYYKTHATKDDNLCALWHFSLLEDAEKGDFKAIVAPATPVDETSERGETEALIRGRLKHIMQSVDLDDVTSRDIRNKLEEQLGRMLSDYKEFIDREMLVILGQMDRPSRIFDYLYLGTEWNASNWEELQHNKVEYILNVTKEVDNFFPVHFKYMKIWVSDEASTELLMHWQRTYDFIKEAKDRGSIVLVHCKKGISRSSSTVIAYVMKEYGWSLEKALNYVKEKRGCITPNHGFMEQLQTFDGMLQASSNRHSAVFNPLSMSPLTSHPTLESQPSVSSIHTAVPSEDTDMACSPPTTGLSKSTGDLTEPRLSEEEPEADNSEEDELLTGTPADQPQEVQVVATAQPREAAKQKDGSGSTGKNSATSFFLHATKRLTGQTHISNLALDRSSRSRFNSGRVKQHREKFESRISHSSAPSSSPSFVSDVAKRIGYISVAVTPPLLSRHKKNTDVAASEDSQDNSKNVKNLVDAFERGRDEAGGRRSTNIIVPGRSVMFRLAKVQDWASPLGDGDHRRHTTCHSSQKSAAPVITQRRQCSLAQYPCT